MLAVRLANLSVMLKSRMPREGLSNIALWLQSDGLEGGARLQTDEDQPTTEAVSTEAVPPAPKRTFTGHKVVGLVNTFQQTRI